MSAQTTDRSEPGRRRWDIVAGILDQAAAGGCFPGAQLLVGRGDEVVHESMHGVLATDAAEVSAQTVYDVSSLTKPLVTAAVLLRSIARGDLALRTPVVEVLPEFAAGTSGDELAARRSVTISHLLAHESGLPARRLYFRKLEGELPEAVATGEGKKRIEAMAIAEPLERAPGRSAVYSDVGFIVLGALLERVAGSRLDRLAAAEIFEPLELGSARFIDLELAGAVGAAAGTIAPCGDCDWRAAIVRGAVQDENAYAMGGVAGHAGLFSTARDLHAIVAQYVRAHGGRESLFDRDLVRACWAVRGTEKSTWVLGWDTPTPGASSAGSRVSAAAVGHLGFTGTSVWIDLERGLHVLLLTNRVHPSRENTAIRELRPRLHDAVFEVLD